MSGDSQKPAAVSAFDLTPGTVPDVPERPATPERPWSDPLDRVTLAAFDDEELRAALRKTLFKYKLHQDMELFEHAYEYIREYY